MYEYYREAYSEFMGGILEKIAGRALQRGEVGEPEIKKYHDGSISFLQHGRKPFKSSFGRVLPKDLRGKIRQDDDPESATYHHSTSVSPEDAHRIHPRRLKKLLRKAEYRYIDKE